MKRTGLIWILFQLDATLPIQLNSNYPYQLPPSNLINSYLSDWQFQHEALRNQWNEQEREREIDKQKQDNVKSEAKPKLKLTSPAALRLEQQPLSSQPRVQAEEKSQTNLQPIQNVIQSSPQSQSLASLAPNLGEQLEKLKQSPVLQDKNNRGLFQNSNGCACMANDYSCNNECIQQRMLQQASSVIGCMTACAAQSIGAIQNCMLGCSNVYYAQVTAPVPTPVSETPSPSSTTDAPSSTQQQSSSSSETPTSSSSSQESSATSTSSDSSTTTDSSSSTTPSETTTPTSSQSSTSSSPTPTNSGNPNINGTVDGTDDDDDDDDSAFIIGAKHTLIVVSISTLLTLFVI